MQTSMYVSCIQVFGSNPCLNNWICDIIIIINALFFYHYRNFFQVKERGRKNETFISLNTILSHYLLFFSVCRFNEWTSLTQSQIFTSINLCWLNGNIFFFHSSFKFQKDWSSNPWEVVWKKWTIQVTTTTSDRHSFIHSSMHVIFQQHCGQP